MNVTFIGGSTGSGKSLRARQHVVANPGRYLLALPRIDSIREFELDYIRALPDRKMVHAIYSDNKRRGNVKSQIEELPRLFKDAEHVVVMITHEGLMQADLSGFVGWHLIIDENVNAVLSGEIIAPQLSRMLHLIYALKPSPSTGWSDVSVIPEESTASEIHADAGLKALATFDKCIRGQHTTRVNIEDWSLGARNKTAIKWYAFWSIYDACQHFDSIMMVGADLERSLFWKATLKAHANQITVNEVKLANRRTKPLSIKIGYFTDSHKGSTTFWQSADGKECIKAIGLWGRGLGQDYYWSANDCAASMLKNDLKGRYVKPKQEGSNRLMQYPTCLFIYSGKALPTDQILEDVFGLTSEEITESRETIDINQFVNRGASRDPNYDGEYRIYLYSKDQAEALEATLNHYGMGTVTLEPLTCAGILDVKRKAEGLAYNPPQMSATEHKEERKRKDREAKKQKRAAMRAEALKNGNARMPLTAEEKKASKKANDRDAQRRRRVRLKQETSAAIIVQPPSPTDYDFSGIEFFPMANTVSGFITVNASSR